jgi:hypothetical protein
MACARGRWEAVCARQRRVNAVAAQPGGLLGRAWSVKHGVINSLLAAERLLTGRKRQNDKQQQMHHRQSSSTSAERPHHAPVSCFRQPPVRDGLIAAPGCCLNCLV